MATITVEDGSRVTGANSYLSEAALSTYATDRGVTISGTAAVLLIKAMDYIEGLNFKGSRTAEDQALSWPRSGVWVDGVAILSDEIPAALREAQAEAAIAIDGGTDPLTAAPRDIKREKVEGIEVEYFEGSPSEINRRLRVKLSRLLSGIPLSSTRV